MDVTEPVNLMQSVFVCNTFNFLFAASKACLFPFLTLYLRLLGLTATQTGIVMAGKTISAFIFAPLWAMCSAKFRKRRLVLMFSIFMMALTYLGLTLVMNVNHAATSCPGDTKTPSGSIKGPLQDLYNDIKTKNQSNANNMQTTTLQASNMSHLLNVTSTSPSTTIEASTKGTKEMEDLFNYGRKLLVRLGLSQSDVDDLSDLELIDLFQDMISKDYMKVLKENLTPEEMEEFFTFFDRAVAMSGAIRIKRAIEKRSLEDTWEKFKENFKALKGAWNVKITEAEVEGQIFLILLLTLVFGEVFCSPVEKIADDAWFEFLEKIDNLEKYGKQRIFTSLAYILLPFIVAVSVDNTKCLFSLNMHPISLHFYLFGAFLGLTFLVAFFYPITASDKRKYKTKIIHALNLTCCKCEGMFYMVTLMIVGAIYASYNNFLFWLIQDLHGKELTMGLCVSIANLAEIPMLFFSGPIVRKLGNGLAICLALVVIAGRTLYYSYLWTPWAVLPAEVTHAFTHTIMWYAVLSNPAFSSNPTVDRGVRSVFSSVYFGVGFSAGSILSGIISDHYGLDILFRSCSILAICWCPLFALINRCCARPAVSEIKYTRLLTTEEVNSDSDDDWLEHALKNG